MNAATFSSWLIRHFNRFSGDSTTRASSSKLRTVDFPLDASHFPSAKLTGSAGTTPQWTAETLRSVREIDTATWDSIAGSDCVLRSHAYLEAVETAGVENCTYYYPVLRDSDGRVFAHACVYIIDTDLSQLLPRLLARLSHVVRKLWRRFLITRITECAAPLSTSHSISLDPDKDREQQIALLAAAIDSIAKVERSRLVVIRDFIGEEHKQFDTLGNHGYNLVSNMPVARIRVRWGSYAEYLAAMRARYRKDVKRRISRAEASGQSVKVLEDFGADARLWADQARTVQEKTKGFKREVLPAGYYENMDRNLGDKSLLVTAERDGRAVAHGMLLQDDSTTTATYFGRNRGPAQQEWFHLVNEVIRIGIENNSQYINLGLGSYDAKSNVGADVEPLFVYSKSTIGPVNWLMRRIPQTMDYPVTNPKQVFRGELG